MKFFSQGAAHLALLSMWVQVSAQVWVQLGGSGSGFESGLGWMLPAAEAQTPVANPQTQMQEQMLAQAQSNLQITLQNGMLQCAIGFNGVMSSKGFTDDLIDTGKDLKDLFKSEKRVKREEAKRTGDKKKGGSCTDVGFKLSSAKSDRKKFCETSCEKPSCVEQGCEDFFPDTKVKDWKKTGTDQISACKKQFNQYLEFTQEKASLCPSMDLDRLEAKLKYLQCQSSEMNKAVKAATMILNQFMSQNQRVLEEMKAQEGSMKGQLAEVNRILGVDPERPGSQPPAGSLRAIQMALEGEDFAKFVERADQAPNEEKSIAVQEEGVKQKLVQGQNAQFAACLASTSGSSGSGMAGQTCIRGGKNVPCSPLDRIFDEMGQKVRMNKNNQIMQGERLTRYNQLMGRYEDFRSGLLAQLGGPAGKDSDGKMVSGSYSNSSSVVKVDELIRLNRNLLTEMTRLTGFPLEDRVRSTLASCYNAGENWRVREQSSPAYQNEVNEVRKKRTKLNTDLDTDLQRSRNLYRDTLRALGFSMPAALDLSSCSVSTAARANCAQTMKKQLLDLSAGTGLSTTSIKIPMMGKIQGFAVPCQGVKGCVEALEKVSTQRMGQLSQFVNQKNAFVSQSNNGFDKAMKDMAALLSSAQGGMEGTFQEMNQLASKLKIDSGSLEFLDQEQLEMPKEPGELMRPKDFAKAISANVPPKGLVDFSASKPEELLKSAKEKADEKKRSILDDLKQDRADFKELKAQACIAEVDPKSKENVGSGACDQVTCKDGLDACSDASRTGVWTSILAALNEFYIQGSSKPPVKLEDARNEVMGLAGDCAEVRALCLSCIESKQDKWDKLQQSSDVNAEKAER